MTSQPNWGCGMGGKRPCFGLTTGCVRLYGETTEGLVAGITDIGRSSTSHIGKWPDIGCTRTSDIGYSFLG